MHVHVYCSDGEAKFWLDPEVELARNCGLSQRQLHELAQVIKERRNDIEDAWKKHFRS